MGYFQNACTQFESCITVRERQVKSEIGNQVCPGVISIEGCNSQFQTILQELCLLVFKIDISKVDEMKMEELWLTFWRFLRGELFSNLCVDFWHFFALFGNVLTAEYLVYGGSEVV